MTEQDKELANQEPDTLAAAARIAINGAAALAAIRYPYLAPLLAPISPFLSEAVGFVIPKQRMDRVAKFATVFEKKGETLDQEQIRAHLNNENFVGLLEDSVLEAARSLTDERREYIANLLVNSLSQEDIEFIESKYLLRILGEINDIEVIWLMYSYNQQFGGEDLWGTHSDILAPRMVGIDSEESEHDKEALQKSYEAHLAQLGLLGAEYKIDSNTLGPEINPFVGGFTVESYKITQLGSLLVRFISDQNDTPPDPPQQSWNTTSPARGDFPRTSNLP